MAMYGPLTDAFREFNHLMINQQTRKDQLGAVQADRDFQKSKIHLFLIQNPEERFLATECSQHPIYMNKEGHEQKLYPLNTRNP